MSKPTIIVVCGAWHTPFHYRAITSFFESQGYPAICKQNPTCGATDPKVDNNDDAAAIRKLIDGVDGDVVVFMHSYGGIPGAAAPTGAKNVIGLIFCSAFVLPAGTSLSDSPDHDKSWSEIDLEKGMIINTRPRECFYHDVDEVAAQEAIERLLPQNVSCFGTPSNSTSWHDLPKIYAVCTDDRILPAKVQEEMVDKAGNWLEVKHLNTSHSPWMSKEAEFNAWLLGAVEKLVDNKPKSSGHH